ncbi:hypothetical protein Tco_0346373, partial [Tanacetum coccineum]
MITNSTTMVVLESCPKYNMVAYLEKTDGNAEIGEKEVLEEIVDAKGLADDTLDYMDTENAQNMGRSRFVVHEEKEREEKEVSTEDVVSTNKEKVSTDRSRVSTDKEEVSTDRPDEGTDDQTEGRSATPITQTPTLITFG